MDFTGFVSNLWLQLSELIQRIILAVLSVLPDSPFQVLTVNQDVYKYLQYLNWFLPVNFFVSSMEVWLSAIAIYYIYSLILRWVKAID